MSRRVHFRVVGRFDLASRAQLATVTLDRLEGTFAVRPFRRRKVYRVALAQVAELVVRRLIAAEVAERRSKRRRRR